MGRWCQRSWGWRRAGEGGREGWESGLWEALIAGGCACRGQPLDQDGRRWTKEMGTSQRGGRTVQHIIVSSCSQLSRVGRKISELLRCRFFRASHWSFVFWCSSCGSAPLRAQEPLKIKKPLQIRVVEQCVGERHQRIQIEPFRPPILLRRAQGQPKLRAVPLHLSQH